MIISALVEEQIRDLGAQVEDIGILFVLDGMIPIDFQNFYLKNGLELLGCLGEHNDFLHFEVARYNGKRV